MLEHLTTRFRTNIDSILMNLITSALVIGLFTLYSASEQNINLVLNQLLYISLGLILLLITASIHPKYYKKLALPIYIFSLLLLFAVMFVGQSSHGAKRWLNLGIFKVQPSEIMRIVVPISMAWYLSMRENKRHAIDYLIASLFFILPVILIIDQPDLGTGLLITASGFYILFLAGLNWKFFVGCAVGLFSLAPVIWAHLYDYQKNRLLILLDPNQDPLGSGYHTIQSSIAMGSGGLIGKGWLNGSQSQLDFLPERTTDFIFAVFSEEFGLLGSLLLLGLYAFIIARSLMIASQAKNTFSRLLAANIGLTFFTYIFINIAMVSGIMPVVGVPLPLISFGGTSMIIILMSFGILMSVHAHKELVGSS
jgi:rod shape determining protein RodA